MAWYGEGMRDMHDSPLYIEIRNARMLMTGWQGLIDHDIMKRKYPFFSKENIITQAENEKIRGKEVRLKALERCIDEPIRIQDVSSRNGIPDFVQIESGEGTVQECIAALCSDPNSRAVVCSSPSEKIKIRREKQQPFTGTGNAREQRSVEVAAKSAGMTVPQFVTQSTLYMARFINRHHKDGYGACYTPGEAFLHMVHGEQMQDAYTPEEIKQVLDNVGLGGGRLADLIMEELKAFRDIRKKGCTDRLQDWGVFKSPKRSEVDPLSVAGESLQALTSDIERE